MLTLSRSGLLTHGRNPAQVLGGRRNKKPGAWSEVFCRTQVKLGYLKDDEKAQELLAALDQQQAVLIDQHYSADIGSTIGHLIGMDYEAVEPMSAE